MPSAAMSATGWPVPTSLLAAITATRAVRPGWRSAPRRAGSTRPSPSTGARSSCAPASAAAQAAASSTAWCSTAEQTRCRASGARARTVPLTARLSASVPPEVNTTSPGAAPTRAATCSRAVSTAALAARPWPCWLDGLAAGAPPPLPPPPFPPPVVPAAVVPPVAAAVPAALAGPPVSVVVLVLVLVVFLGRRRQHAVLQLLGRLRPVQDLLVGHGHGHEVMPDLGWERATRHPLALDVVHRLLALGVAHPDRHRQLRGVADEPGVAVLLVGAGLAGGRTADVGPGAGAAGDHALEDVGDLPGERGRDPALGLGRLPDHRLAVAVVDLLEEGRLVVLAQIGQGGIRAGHVDRADLGGAEGHRRHPLVDRGDAELLGHLGHPVGAEPLHQAAVDAVDRAPGGVPDRHRPGPAALVVLDLPRGAADELVEAARLPDRVGRDPGLQRRGQHEGLERRPGLAADALEGDVVGPRLEVAAADHRPDSAVAGVDGDQGDVRAGRGPP